MTEARYRGQKVVVVAPDYADNVKFADEWLAPTPGTDGARAVHGARDPQGVLRRAADGLHRLHKYTDLPYLVVLDETPRGLPAGKFLTAADLPSHEHERTPTSRPS